MHKYGIKNILNTYTLLDLFRDVGGLFFALTIITYILNLIFGSYLSEINLIEEYKSVVNNPIDFSYSFKMKMCLKSKISCKLDDDFEQEY